jgi:pantothenate synthetase
VVWSPDITTMYPEDFSTRIIPEGPVTAGLEDRSRPHFFGGVATVVGKRFTQHRPDAVVCDEKDFQPLRVVTRMAGDSTLASRSSVRESSASARASQCCRVTHACLSLKQPKVAQFAPQRLGHRRNGCSCGLAEIGRGCLFGQISPALKGPHRPR